MGLRCSQDIVKAVHGVELVELAGVYKVNKR